LSHFGENKTSCIANNRFHVMLYLLDNTLRNYATSKILFNRYILTVDRGWKILFKWHKRDNRGIYSA